MELFVVGSYLFEATVRWRRFTSILIIFQRSAGAGIALFFATDVSFCCNIKFTLRRAKVRISIPARPASFFKVNAGYNAAIILSEAVTEARRL